MDKEKVYCKNCKHLETRPHSLYQNLFWCKLHTVYKDTWYDKIIDEDKFADPSIINKNNDCKDFEQKK